MPIEKFFLGFTRGQISVIKELIDHEVEVENDKPDFCTRRLGRLLKVKEEIETLQKYLGHREAKSPSII